MKGRPIDQLVYETMFPKPRQQDPHNFQALLQRYLVLEVRQEVHSFYGHLDTPEAKYPGLDYTHNIHRIRLGRWPWHRRLFRAFDALRLTHSEIASLTKWEGTKWAKERYEREQGITIRDTTSDGFPEYVAPENRRTPNPPPEEQEQEEGEEEAETQTPQETQEIRIAVANGTGNANGNDNRDDEGINNAQGDESDGELESVGFALNERLRERVALRNLSGDLSMPLDEEWENWLKNAIESGEIPHIADQIARFNRPNGPNSPLTAEDIFPPHMVAAARDGRWDDIPDFLREMIRQGLRTESSPSRPRQQRPPRRTAATTNQSRNHLLSPHEERRSVVDPPPPHVEA